MFTSYFTSFTTIYKKFAGFFHIGFQDFFQCIVILVLLQEHFYEKIIQKVKKWKFITEYLGLGNKFYDEKVIQNY